jgi:hypothetical protein
MLQRGEMPPFSVAVQIYKIELAVEPLRRRNGDDARNPPA